MVGVGANSTEKCECYCELNEKGRNLEDEYSIMIQR